MPGTYMMRWLCFCIICFTVSIAPVPAISETRTGEAAIAVVYPQVGKPYQDVIDSIMEGIRQQAGSTLGFFSLKGAKDDANLNPWLEQHKTRVVIALAKQGLEATDKLPPGVHRVLGALQSPPIQNGVSYAGGISLVPDPEIVFTKVHELSPATRRIIVVYDPATSDWLIQLAIPAAVKGGIELVALPVKDLREAAATYAQLQEKGLGKTDLIWLLNDPNTVDQNTILPFLLKTSWSDGFTVISNNPSHVNRGVLFSLYPDYGSMGKSIGRLAMEVAANGSHANKAMSPLRDVLIAVNLRTAEHLNLTFSPKEQEAFDLVFPESR